MNSGRALRATASGRVSALLNFESAAVIGASDSSTQIGGRAILLMREFGFRGHLYGVNPRYSTTMTEPCFPSVDDLPEAVDLAVIAVRASEVIRVLPELGRRGTRAAVVFSAGFGTDQSSSTTPARMLREIAAEYDMALLGPNSLGLVSFVNRRCASFASALQPLAVAPGGGMGLVTQSGAVAMAVVTEAAQSGVTFSHVLTTGNEAVVGVAEVLEFFAEDPSTLAVMAYMEGLSNGLAFAESLRRLQAAGKPIVLLKVGTSPAGVEAARSHTGLMSGNDDSFQAACDRYGAYRVRSLDALIDHARIVSMLPLVGGVTIVTSSGGAGIYAADTCADLDLPMTDLSEESRLSLSEVVPSFGSAKNPVDLTAHAVSDRQLLRRGLEVAMQDRGTGVVLVLLGGQSDPALSSEVIRLLAELSASSPVLVAVVWLGATTQMRAESIETGLVVFSDPIRFLTVLSAHRVIRGRPSTGRPGTSRVATSDQGFDGDPIDERRSLVGEWEALSLLDSAGVRSPKRVRASTEEEVDEAADFLKFPVVMKVLIPVIPHRAELGGVLLGIRTRHSLMVGWRKLVRSMGAKQVIIAEQATPGVELLVGAAIDDCFGERLVLGAGGTHANELADFVTLIPPFSREYMRAQLLNLAEAWDPAAREIVRTQAAAISHAMLAVARVRVRSDLAEFECNPLIVTTSAVTAVDGFGVSSSTRRRPA